MRCRFCGSESIRQDTEHKNFSKGKAVAGVVAIGVVGAAAGLIGKDQKGYRCAACGCFMEVPMDASTDMSISIAIRDAEQGRNRSMYDYYKKQYCNIAASIPAAKEAPAASYVQTVYVPAPATPSASSETIKHNYRNLAWDMDCPVFVEEITILTLPDGDALRMKVRNVGNAAIRSAYFSVKVLDDTGDLISEQQCVYQGQNAAPGALLSETQTFPLKTTIAYRVELSCEKIALADNAVWRKTDGQTATLAPQPVIDQNNFPRYKYMISELAKVSKTVAEGTLYLPVESPEYWQCICGTPVKNNRKCPHCGCDLAGLNEVLSQKTLRLIQQCEVKARAATRAEKTMAAYNAAFGKKQAAEYALAEQQRKADTEESLLKAITGFEQLGDYNDAKAKAQACRDRIPALRKELQEKAEEQKRLQEEREQRRAEQEKQAKEAKKKKIIIGTAMAAVAVLILLFFTVISPSMKYKDAEMLAANGNYTEAAIAFERLGTYKDAATRTKEMWYLYAEKELAEGNYDDASNAFAQASDYLNATERIIEPYYWQGMSLMNEERYLDASDAFVQAKTYSDAADQYCIAMCKYAESLIDASDYDTAAQAFTQLNNGSNSMGVVFSHIGLRIGEPYYIQGQMAMETGNYETAVTALKKAGDYSGAKELLKEAEYLYASELQRNGLYENAYSVYTDIIHYKDVDITLSDECFIEPRNKAYHTSGSIVLFGHYEQDNDPSNGKEPIAWVVLAVTDETAMLVSLDILDYQPFISNEQSMEIRKSYSSKYEIPWGKSFIRDWLNGDFADNAFDQTEIEMISEKENHSHYEYTYKWNGKEQSRWNAVDTIDKINLMDVNPSHYFLNGDYTEEYHGYRLTDDQKYVLYEAKPTAYASAVCCSLTEAGGNAPDFLAWWTANFFQLKEDKYDAQYTPREKSFIGNSILGVRPMIYINLSSSMFQQ